MKRLVSVGSRDDIFPEYKKTPIGDLFEYHNLGRSLESCENGQLLIGMCMDNRKHLRIPDNFAYVIRAGGANIRYSEFKVSYAIAIGEIQHLALIGHNKCGMVDLVSRKDQFINGLVERAGWERERAEEHFSQYAPMFEIGDEIDFVLSEAARLRANYPKITVAPLFYNVDDNRLYLIHEIES